MELEYIIFLRIHYLHCQDWYPESLAFIKYLAELKYSLYLEKVPFNRHERWQIAYTVPGMAKQKL
jgi:hypothetical protein